MTFLSLISVKGMDYLDPTPFDILFSSGKTVPETPCINVTTIDDDAWEGTQNFLVTIAVLSNIQVSIGVTSNLTVVVVDNDGEEIFSVIFLILLEHTIACLLLSILVSYGTGSYIASSTAAVTVSFTQTTYNVTEGDSNVNMCVEISSAPAAGLEEDLLVTFEFASSPIAGEIIMSVKMAFIVLCTCSHLVCVFPQ